MNVSKASLFKVNKLLLMFRRICLKSLTKWLSFFPYLNKVFANTSILRLKQLTALLYVYIQNITYLVRKKSKPSKAGINL